MEYLAVFIGGMILGWAGQHIYKPRLNQVKFWRNQARAADAHIEKLLETIKDMAQKLKAIENKEKKRLAGRMIDDDDQELIDSLKASGREV